MSRDDQAVCATRPERHRFFEKHAHRKRIELFDLDVLVAADSHRSCGRIGRIFPVEHYVIGGERPPVVPLHAFFELPGHRHAVGSDPAILYVRDFGGEHRHQAAVGTPRRQRLVEDPTPFGILGADGEMRVEQGRALPEQCLERPTAAGSGRLVFGCSRRLDQPRSGQQHMGKRRREAETDQLGYKGPTRHAAGSHCSEQIV